MAHNLNSVTLIRKNHISYYMLQSLYLGTFVFTYIAFIIGMFY